MHIRQVVVTGPCQVELQKLELEEKIGPEQLLIDSEYTFISAGTELANYTGREPRVFQQGSWCAYPWRSGYANVGVVRAAGERVSRARVGQRVFTYGPHASSFLYSEKRLVAPVPGELDPALVASSRMAGVALTALVLAEIRGNPWVAVFGLGMVGNLAAQAFGLHGGRVVGIDPVAHRRQLAERCGIEHTLGGSSQEVQQAIEELSEGHLADIAIDAVGHSSVVMQALRATATHGQLILLGSPRVRVQGDLTELLSEVHLRFITVRGGLEWCLPMYPDVGGGQSQFGKQQMIFDWMRRGRLRLEPLVSHRLRPEQIKEAYEGLEHHPEEYTGVVLDWT
jgi:2-desacetyl-2-hydroxyethyl bacteriochlorophyllide A dehydrogenase